MFTSGKRAASHDFRLDQQMLQERGIDIVTIPRGGQTTFHGPGQLVVYPILNLHRLRIGARQYVEGLEDVMIAALGAYGVTARVRAPCFPAATFPIAFLLMQWTTGTVPLGHPVNSVCLVPYVTKEETAEAILPLNRVEFRSGLVCGWVITRLAQLESEYLRE